MPVMSLRDDHTLPMKTDALSNRRRSLPSSAQRDRFFSLSDHTPKDVVIEREREIIPVDGLLPAM